MNDIADVFFILDSRGRFLSIATSDPVFLPKPPADLRDKTLPEVYPPAQARRFLRSIHRAFETRQTVKLEYRLRLDRKQVWFSAVINPVSKNRVTWIAWDVTNRKRTETALQASETKFRKLIQSANDAIFIADPATGIILDANTRAEQLLGLPIKQIIGMHQAQLHPPEEGERYRKIFQEHIQTGKAITDDLFVLHSDGRRIPVEISASVVHLGNQRVVQGIFRDLTARKQAEEERRETEEQFRILFETMPVGLGVADLSGNLLAFNDAILQPGGYTRDEIFAIGNVANLYVDPAERDAVLALARHQGYVHQHPVKFKRKNGTPYNALLSLAPIHFRGKPCWQAIVEDVTERVRAEAALRESEQQFRLLFQRSPVGIFQYDKQLRIADCNDRFVAILQSTRERIIGLDLNTLRDPSVLPALRTALDGREGFHEGFYHATASPVSLWISIHTAPLLDEHGKVKSGVCIVEDISERKHAEQELQHRADEFAVLYAVSRDLAAQQDLSTLLQTIVQRAAALLAAPNGTICLFDEERNDLEIVASHGVEMPIGTRLALGEGMAGRVALSREPVIVDDYGNWEYRSPKYADGAFRAGIAVPMLFSGRLIGTLNLIEAADRTRTFKEADARLLSLFAAQAASAVHNTRLFEETRHRLTELETIHRISTALRTASTVDEMLPRLLDETLAMLATPAGMIRLFDAEGALRQLVARGWFAQIQRLRLTPGEGIVGTVYLTGKPYLSKEFAVDPAVAESVRAQIPRGWGGAGIPIRSAQGFVGVILVATQSPRELTESEVNLLTTVAEIAGNAIQRTRLHEELEEAYVETVLALAKAIDARDSYTGNHSEELEKMAIAIARAKQMSLDEQEALRYAARLHDIGKIGVPDAILGKPGPLNAEEWNAMKKHPAIGAEIIEHVQRLRRAVPIVRHHHEKFDGSGYPDGLAGEAIPLGARILTLVDAFSAMTDDRVYRVGKSRDEALAEVQRCAGTHFDPQVVQVFLSTVGTER